MNIHYLEVVTTDVDAVCALYSAMHSIEFGDADPTLGGARTAAMASGGMIGVRGPLRPDEGPTLRSYVLVEDIEAAVDAAEARGAAIAVRAMPIPGHGTCAIVIEGGIEFGLWQL